MDLVGIRLGMTAETMIFMLDCISVTLSEVVIFAAGSSPGALGFWRNCI